jgi:large subunit ribosomal protein L19
MPDEETKNPAIETPEISTAAPEETHGRKGQMIKTEDVRPGMTIRIFERIKDISPKGEERERLQVFQGIVIGIHGAGNSKTMTIRREQKGYGVEKIFPLKSPVIARIELVKTARVRRARLSFLSDLRHPFKRKLKETWVE